VNRCREGSPEGALREASGKAEVADRETGANLKVWFFWPFKGDYWIIDLDEDYRWAVVGEPARRYLWILSRSPVMEEAVYRDIAARLPRKGYDPARLRRTVHGSARGD